MRGGMGKLKLTEKQTRLLSILAHKAPRAAWQLAEDLGTTTFGVSKIAGPLIQHGYIKSGGHGYFPLVTANGSRVHSIPDGEDNERMVQEFIARHGVTRIPRGVSAIEEPTYFKKSRKRGSRKGR